MSEKIIIGLVGEMSSGKGALKKYLEEKYQATDCRFSSILRDVLGRLSVPVSRENLQQLSTILRQNFGEDLLAKVIVSDAQKLAGDLVVIDGVRRFADIKYLTAEDNFFLVAIAVEPKIRYERMVVRNENTGDAEKAFEQFMAEGKAESEKEIVSVMKQADFTIDNNGSWEKFFYQIDEIISKLRTK